MFIYNNNNAKFTTKYLLTVTPSKCNSFPILSGCLVKSFMSVLYIYIYLFQITLTWYGHVRRILNTSLTLKAYFLLMWSSTDSMEMWKLGRRILPKIPSSFSSEDTKRETLWTLAYVRRRPGHLLNLQLKPWLGVYFSRGVGKQTV